MGGFFFLLIMPASVEAFALSNSHFFLFLENRGIFYAHQLHSKRAKKKIIEKDKGGDKIVPLPSLPTIKDFFLLYLIHILSLK